MRLDHAMLFVKDLERMTAFYRDVMGLEPIEATRMDDWVEFEGGPIHFALHAIPAHIAKDIPVSDPPKPREQGSCRFAFTVDDLDAEETRLAARGVMLLRRPWGAWDVVDPEGNVLGMRQA